MSSQKVFVVVALFAVVWLLSLADSQAQCAMCRASVSSSISEGGNLGKNLNTGILYLAAMPYILIATLAWLWYRNSKKRHASLNTPPKFS